MSERGCAALFLSAMAGLLVLYVAVGFAYGLKAALTLTLMTLIAIGLVAMFGGLVGPDDAG